MYDLARIAAAAATAVGTSLTAVAVKSPDGKRSWLGLPADASATLYRSTDADRDLYSVARCVSSESAGPPAVLLGIAEAVWAEAEARGISAWDLLVNRTSKDGRWDFTRGRYGEQHGRYASTRRTPTVRSMVAARMAREGSDIARGARAWMAPKVNDDGRQGGRNLRDAITVAKEWAMSGREWIGPMEGVDSYRQAFFRQLGAGKRADVSAFVEMVERGRRGIATIGPTRTGSPTAHNPNPPALTLGGAAVAAGAAVVGAKLIR